MKCKIIVSVLFAVFFFSGNAFCKVRLFFPPNNTLFESDTIKLMGISDEKSDREITVKIQGSGIYEYKFREIKVKVADDNTFSTEARLYPGTNRLSFLDENIDVYYDDKSETVPYAYSKLYEHSEPDCGNCHKMKPVFSEELTGEVGEICAECHDKVEGKKNIHPGFEDSSCIDCHNPHFSKYESHLKDKMTAVCYGCHDIVTEIKGASFVIVHSPVEQEKCSKCHDPHASDNDHLLLKKKYDLCTGCHKDARDFGHADNYDDCSMCHEHHVAKSFILLKENYSENCLDCHDEVTEQKFKHQSKGRGCGDCHDPHSDTDAEDVLKGCRSCHKSSDKEFSRFHGGLELPVEKCFLCHTPHNAYNKRLLRSKLHFPLTQAGNCIVCHEMKKKKRKELGFTMEKSEICFKCHGDKKPLVGYDRSVHPPVLYGDCIQCHSPHLKLTKKQLLLPVEVLCYKCHENFIEKAATFQGGSLHIPVEENDCLLCHDSHQSENVALLKSKLNDICFECHSEKVATFNERTIIFYHDPPTEDLCTSCHSPHISKRSNLLKEKE